MALNSETVGIDESGAEKPAKKPRGTTTRNPTMIAIAKISRVLDELPDGDTQLRVLAFIADEYGFETPSEE